MADVLLWAFEHGVTIGLVALVLAIPVALAWAWRYLWFLQGAKTIAAVWVWRRAWWWWRSRSSPFAPSGGAGGGGYSPEYLAFMQSPAWRDQRGRVLRRDGHRCAQCGGRRGLEAHHLWYASPLRDTPDWGITDPLPAAATPLRTAGTPLPDGAPSGGASSVSSGPRPRPAAATA